MLLLFNMITYCKSRMADWNNLLVLSAIFTRKSSCILVTFMADKKTTWMPSSEELVPNIFTPRPPNGDRNFCEKGYNATAALMGPNMLKDPKRPFQIVVERRGALSLLSLYFSGCDSSLRWRSQVTGPKLTKYLVIGFPNNCTIGQGIGAKHLVRL